MDDEPLCGCAAEMSIYLFIYLFYLCNSKGVIMIWALLEIHCSVLDTVVTLIYILPIF